MTPPNHTITTTRLVIRPWQRTDLDAYERWPPFADQLLAIFNHAPRSSLELDLEWAAAQLNPSQQFWTIVTDGTVIGRITLRALPDETGSGQLGMLLGAPYVGQRFGTEALVGWLQAYFGRWQMQSVTLHVACWNQRARHMYERVGFAEVRRYWQTAGLPADYPFLHEPQYAPLAACFRWSQTELYASWTEMCLTRRQWSPSVAQ
ncbi:MAG: GNAT family N-acetyltransferase [Herpetosiphonaceae bacterium]|nr:GNAT family N-acetyltransferase [Herpetosiphonaceae bacterium]